VPALTEYMDFMKNVKKKIKKILKNQGENIKEKKN
jgi:hypothetical protein